MTKRWAPIGRESVDTVLAEGIPRWLLRSVVGWEEQFVFSYPSNRAWQGAPALNVELFQEYERRFQVGIHWGRDSTSTWSVFQQQHLNSDLKVVEFLDFLIGHFAHREQAAELARILEQGASVWGVGDTPGRASTSGRGLIRRVVPGVQEAMEDVLHAPGRASDFLKKARTLLFGTEPDPNQAYREVINAVEAAACPVVTPNDPKGQLGKVVGVWASPPAFTIALNPRQETNPKPWATVDPSEVLRAMLCLLDKSQPARHGEAVVGPHTAVSQQQAETAFFLAVTLVQWFESGSVRKA